MPNLPDSFIAAWVLPNHFRFTSIDTAQLHIHNDIPDHLITFTYASSGFIETISDYEILKHIASTFLEAISGDIQVVIDVTGKDEKWWPIWEIHIYNQLKEFWSITRLEKRTSYAIPVCIENSKQVIQEIQARNTDILE